MSTVAWLGPIGLHGNVVAHAHELVLHERVEGDVSMEESVGSIVAGSRRVASRRVGVPSPAVRS